VKSAVPAPSSLRRSPSRKRGAASPPAGTTNPDFSLLSPLSALSSIPSLSPLEAAPEKTTDGPLYRQDGDLTLQEDIALRRLLRLSFPFRLAFLRRRYRHGVPPEHRWLIHDATGTLIAHAAAYDRRIATETGSLLTIGGIAEVCVHPEARGRGFLKQLLAAIHAAYAERGIAFCMLFGAAKLYRSSGYMPISNRVLTRGFPLGFNPFHGTPMIRPLRLDAAWPSGTIDLCGPVF